LREAQNQANEIQAHAEGAAAERVAEAEIMVSNARQEARVEVEQIGVDAVAEADAVIARAKDEGRVLLDQVQEARKRVMADLAARRRALSIQIEQLRAARDEMAASVHGVRTSIDQILGQLDRSDDDARAAASVAADQARLHLPKGLPEGESVTSVEVGEDPALGGAPPSVDELFARIRAATGAPPHENPPQSDDDDDAVQVLGEAVAVVEIDVAEESDAGEEGDDEAEAPVEGPDQELVARRDELLWPISAQLSRHIKRALGDDQNRLLDVLRSTPQVDGEALLGPEEVHLSTFTSAAEGHLADAFAAGTVFAGADPEAISAGGAVEQAAAGLSRTVVTMLRRRIAEGSGSADEMGERVGAAFREWRGERIERLVGDFAVQAFSAGVAAACSSGELLRWVLTSPTGCSDCDDNALAGAVPIDEGFPTGHAYPPAHSGCRCLVVPAPA
jgi:hypothetical protein